MRETFAGTEALITQKNGRIKMVHKCQHDFPELPFGIRPDVQCGTFGSTLR